MTIYGPQIRKVQAALAKKGRAISIRHQLASEDFDPVTDTPTEVDGEVVADVYALVTPPTTMTEQAYADQFRQGTMVRSRTRNVLLSSLDTSGAPLSFDPQEGDHLEFDGYTWELVGVRNLAPDGTTIFWAGTCKR